MTSSSDGGVADGETCTASSVCSDLIAICFAALGTTTTICQVPCNQTQSCPDATVCAADPISGNDACVPLTSLLAEGAACFDTSDCAAGLYCNNNTCAAVDTDAGSPCFTTTTANTACDQDWDCCGGLFCYQDGQGNNNCVPDSHAH